MTDASERSVLLMQASLHLMPPLFRSVESNTCTVSHPPTTQVPARSHLSCDSLLRNVFRQRILEVLPRSRFSPPRRTHLTIPRLNHWLSSEEYEVKGSILEGTNLVRTVSWGTFV